MINQGKSLFELEVKPIVMAGFAAGIMLVFHILNGVLASDLFGARGYWVNALALTFVFTLFNTLFSLTCKNQIQYWSQSIYSYLALCVFGIASARIFSGIPIDEAGSFRWLFLVFTFIQILLLTIASTIRRIITLVLKKDKEMRDRMH